MAIYTFTIVGVHYAVNPETISCKEETEEMHQRTTERLAELDKKRPPVILIHDHTNAVWPRAVMARTEGERIGYVANDQLDTIHAILEQNGGRPVMARIDSVEAKKHGWMTVCVETSAELSMGPQKANLGAWQEWSNGGMPTLPCIESQFVMMEAEVMLEDLFLRLPTSSADTTQISAIEQYIELWIEHSLHDLSNEASLMREHYILKLKELEDEHATIAALVELLKKQRTAICGQKRLKLRAGKWWKELLASAEMELLWNTWVARMGNASEENLAEVEALLRALPCDLYAKVDDKGLLFSSLYYTQVPRQKYWQVISLMLLRERLQSLLKAPLPQPTDTKEEQVEQEQFQVVIPKELQTSEAQKVLAKLQKRGMLDADLQPSSLKGWQRGALAYVLAERFDIKHVWVKMAQMWKCNSSTLRQYYSKEFTQKKSIEFTKKIKAIIY